MREENRTLYINEEENEKDKNNTVYIGKDGMQGSSEQTMYIGNVSEDESNIMESTLYIGKKIVNEDVEEDAVFKGNNNSKEIDFADGANQSQESVQYYLPINTMLQKRYRINSVLGEGGFGITYSGWDITLNIPVAIKEYYPSGLVTRNATLGKTTQVVPMSSEKYGTQFRDGIDRVLDEARRMAKFRNTPGIVSVYDFFEANNTAYIVMEYVKGSTLDKYYENNRIDNTSLFNLLVPVMDALQVLHNEGIIHRDISPDNIMVDEAGNFKLLDFGAARGFTETSSTTMSIVLKKSYAPEEQFRTKGIQGPWTDVYALGATIYELISGQTPPTSIDRLAEDDIIDIRDIAPSLTKGQAHAIMTALAVRQKERWQSINEFKNALLDEMDASIRQTNDYFNENVNLQKENKDEANISHISNVIKHVKNNKKISFIILFGIIAIAIIGLIVSNIGEKGPGYVGVYTTDIPTEVKNKYSINEGAYLTDIVPGSPAEKSQFIAGDIFTTIDKYSISDDDDFGRIMERYKEGERIKIKYFHLSGEEYIEKTKTIKLDDKTKYVDPYTEALSLISSLEISPSGKNDNSNQKSDYEDLTFEFVGFEPYGDSSQYADIYIKINNPNSDTLDIFPSGVYINNISVYDNCLDGIAGNGESILNETASYSETNRKLIGDEITSFRIEYYISGEYGNYRSYEQNDFSYSIDKGEFINAVNIEEKKNIESGQNEEMSTVESIDEGQYAEIINNDLMPGLKLKITNLDDSGASYYGICGLFENDSDEDYPISFWYESEVNGYTLKMKSTSEISSDTIPAHGSCIVTFKYEPKELQYCGITNIDSLRIKIGNGDIEKEDALTASFSGLNLPVESTERTEYSLNNRIEGSLSDNPNSNDIKISLVGYDLSNSSYIALYFDVENLSEKERTFAYWYASTINNVALKMKSTSDLSGDLDGKDHILLCIKYEPKDLEAAGITTIDTLEFKFGNGLDDIDSAAKASFTNLSIPVEK